MAAAAASSRSPGGGASHGAQARWQLGERHEDADPACEMHDAPTVVGDPLPREGGPPGDVQELGLDLKRDGGNRGPPRVIEVSISGKEYHMGDTVVAASAASRSRSGRARWWR